MIINPSWQVVRNDRNEEAGGPLHITWTVTRPLAAVNIDGHDLLAPGMPSGGAATLTITLDARVIASNPVMTIVAGDRTFRVIENLPDGLFRRGERRRP